MNLPTWLSFLKRAEAHSDWMDHVERESTPAYIVPSDTGRLEPGSDTWLYLSTWAADEIARLREKNDSNKLDTIMTAELRGQIKALKRMLALGNPKADRRRLSVEED